MANDMQQLCVHFSATANGTLPMLEVTCGNKTDKIGTSLAVARYVATITGKSKIYPKVVGLSPSGILVVIYYQSPKIAN